MESKLYVGGLAWGTDDQGLRAAFEQIGPVADAKVMTDRETGRSRGFGFVTFVDASNAQKAIQQMDGTQLDGRNIAVNMAKEREPRTGGGGGGGGGGRRDGGGGGGRW